MSAVLLRLAIVMMLLPVLLPASPAAARQGEDQAGSPLSAAACDSTPSESGVGDQQRAAATPSGLPPGLSLLVLSDQSPLSWPRYARGLVMTVRHLTLDPGVASEVRTTPGPLLFYVAGGTVSLSINSRMQAYEAGSAVLVELGQRYLLRNDLDAPVRLVRVQLTPPATETTVSVGEPAEVHGVEREASLGPPFLANRLLVSAEAPAMQEGTHLVLACLRWVDAAAEARDVAHPGPVALFVLEGQLRVGETGTREAGDCVVFQSQVVHDLRAGDPAPVVLLVGALPAGAELWNPASAAGRARSTGRLSFHCGEETATSTVPGVARMAARHTWVITRR